MPRSRCRRPPLPARTSSARSPRARGRSRGASRTRGLRRSRSAVSPYRNMPGNQAFLRPRPKMVATASDTPLAQGRTYTSTMPAAERTLTIAHISDIHSGGPHFMPSLMDRAIGEINDLQPDIIICTGDLTTFGFKQEFAQAKTYLDRLECDSLVVVPGNHDSRNVGYVHFEQLFGARNSVLHLDGVSVVAVDSTEPDLDHGQIGRGRYRWIEESFAGPADLRVFVCHHHLLPVPGTGRERNVIYDAGDTIECLQRSGVNLVLSGHKHVPYAWR